MGEGENGKDSAPEAQGERKSDEELLQAYRNGDLHAMGELFARYRRRAVTFATRVTLDTRDGEALAREAFTMAAEKAEEFGGDEQFGIWFIRILKDCCYKFVNAKREEAVRALRWHPGGEPVPLGRGKGAGGGGELPPAAQPTAQKVFDVLVDLAPVYREALCLTILGGMDFSVAGEICGEPETTVRSRAAFALNNLYQKLFPPKAPPAPSDTETGTRSYGMR